MQRDPGPRGARRALGRLLEAVLASRGEANAVFDILAVLQSEDQEEIQDAVRACSRLFGALLERGELFVGQLPPEEAVMAGSQGATRKYRVWMRHRYQSCCNRLAELLAHPSFQVKELALGTLMKFVRLEGAHPLEKPKWEGSYLFPRQLLKAVVEGLLSLEEDRSLLLSQFREYLEHDDVRYHVMQAVTDTVARVASGHPEVPLAFWNNAFTLLSAVSLPLQESDLANFYVKRSELSDKWKVTHLKEHRRAFQAMWLGFLKHKLPLSLYKKVLVIVHDAILPHLAQPSLLIDFLTRAYDVGGAISLLALNGLFILIHKHNLYRARFFHLADLFLSSSHLPAYLVAAFAKRLARLALTAPPEALLLVLPFVCNLLRRHPACRVLVHRPRGPELDADPYDPDEEDPAKSRALESSLWELQALQRHYHPEVSKAAGVINQVLSVPEASIAPLLELTAFEMFERDLKKKGPEAVPLEFIPAQGLLGRPDDLCAQHFSLG
ncbi:nucleolar complex protein 4 homolog isoform X3 [Phyllostomus hastatus]|uniref:nucleolar complex protein 4 homolog isoform X3 n=1 Tax=Phyllostomus hastatus TaxID=9423 RepID=UPI001E6808A6|nr:nucleolar complex protein 4 homolog isoform X3 [Phyllostomus hastatus]